MQTDEGKSVAYCTYKKEEDCTRPPYTLQLNTASNLYRGQLRNPLQQRLVRRVLGVEHRLKSRAGGSLGQTQPAHVHVETNPHGDGRSRRWRNRRDITTRSSRRRRRRLVMVMTAPSVGVVLSSSNTNTAHSAAAVWKRKQKQANMMISECVRERENGDICAVFRGSTKTTLSR